MLKTNNIIFERVKWWRLVLNQLRCDSSTCNLNDEYTSKPEYPPIYEVTPVNEENMKKLEYYEQLKKLATVEEKLFALNVPRYYGWPSFILKEGVIPYNFLTFIQHITRTELSEADKLPILLETEKANELLKKIKLQLEKVLVFENCGKTFRFQVDGTKNDMSNSEINDVYSKNLIQQINRIFINNLVSEYPHLLLSQVDYAPRLESFWRVGGFYPTDEDKKLRKFKKLPEERHDEPIERCFQYFGSPVLQIRSRLPLTPLFNNSILKSRDEESVVEKNNLSGQSDLSKSVYYPIQPYNYDPYLYYRVPRERVMAVVSPGFWPNDPYQFGLMSYHSRGYLVDRPPNFGETDTKESLHAQGILSSYAWTLGQAYYQGFSTFYDITYPFVTQTIITDGKLFNFYTYQLNSTVLHSDFSNETNPLKNICHGTTTQEIYHEIKDNKVIGWNDQVLYNLLSFYANVPSKPTDVDMQPYLDKTVKVVANIEETERRIWLHDHYRYHVSRRPRVKLEPEIYDWERIYKVEFNKRPLDARRKFFEIEQDPINDRKLFQHKNKFIPKAERPSHWHRKQKLEDVYYPMVYPDYVDIV